MISNVSLSNGFITATGYYVAALSDLKEITKEEIYVGEEKRVYLEPITDEEEE